MEPNDIESKNSNSFIRNIDEIGRVVLPVEFRQLLNINNVTKLKITKENNCLIIKKYT